MEGSTLVSALSEGFADTAVVAIAVMASHRLSSAWGLWAPLFSPWGMG